MNSSVVGGQIDWQAKDAAGSESALTSKPIRLDYLDGLRGFAALFVMLGHLYNFVLNPAFGTVDNTLSPMLIVPLSILGLSHFAVSVFIVLSGFCLMIPVAKSPQGSLAGGLLGFFTRRARRILPPYYAVLAVVVCLTLLSHHFIRRVGPRVDVSWNDVLLHVFLLHNLSQQYFRALDGPMWSVAVEWQIYFIFALILLPFWRSFGSWWTIAIAFFLSFLPVFVLPTAHNLYWAHPWFLGLFSLGMAGATFMFSSSNQHKWVKNIRFQNIGLVATAAGFALMVATVHCLPQYLPPEEILVGLFTTLLIIAVGNVENRSWPIRSVRAILSARAAVVLGAFSYSLYLLHDPILSKFEDVISKHHFSSAVQLLILLGIGAPLCLAVAYVFHFFIERPFMSGHPKTERETEIAAVFDPAP